MASKKRVDTKGEAGGVTVASGDISKVYGDIVIGDKVYGDIVIGDSVIHIGSIKGTTVNIVSPSSPSVVVRGKGVWISKIEQAESGDIQRIDARARSAGFSHVVIKVGDGDSFVGQETLIRQLNESLAELNIRLFGSHRVYGKDVKAEADTAVRILSTIPLDGYILDAETEFSTVEANQATDLMRRIQEKAGTGRLGLTSFKYPSYQPMPWAALLQESAFMMPQVFWENASNPAAQLERSVREFRKLNSNIPIIPIGSAYATGSWRPKPDEIHEFIRSAHLLYLPAVGFWNWDTAGLPEYEDLWDAIASDDWDNWQESDESSKRAEPKHAGEGEHAASSRKVFHIPVPRLESRVLQIVHNDEVQGVEDKLGYKDFVESFVQLIMDPGTRPPLTVGISGAWGSGKTFILSHVSEELEKRQGEQKNTGKRPFWKAKDRPSEVHVIKFNAWEYNAAEAVWPGLVRKILDTMERKSGYLNTWLSRARRNFTRQIARSNWKFVPWIIVVVAILIAFFYLARWDLRVLLTLLGAVGLTGLISMFQSLVGTPTAQWITNLFSEREYGKLIGYMDDIQKDIRELGKNLPSGTKIVVMIDDLDRCSPEKIVEVLEAIKLLLNFELFIVIMAVDANVITRAVEKRYEKTLADVGRSGHVYLDKIIQIPFCIPEPGPALVSEYLFSLLTAAEIRKKAEKAAVRGTQWHIAILSTFTDLSEKQRDMLARALNGLSNEGLFPPGKWLEEPFPRLIWKLVSTYWPVSGYLLHKQLMRCVTENPDQYAEEPVLPALWKDVVAANDLQARRLQLIADAPLPLLEDILSCCNDVNVDVLASILEQQESYVISRTFNPTELEAFQLLAPYLIKNPRHIKRMVNTYSLVRVLAARTPEGKTVTSDPEAVLKWLIISAQWPVTARIMLSAFADVRDKLRPGEVLPDNNNILGELHSSAEQFLARDARMADEVSRLDGDGVLLSKLVSTGHALSSQQLDLLRTYSINFNPIFEHIGVQMAREDSNQQTGQ